MPSNKKMGALAQLGQSVWLDYINRSMIESGKLKALIDDGLRGMTSNPAIFNQVISSGSDYDPKIQQLKDLGRSTFDVYDEVTAADIADACDLFRPVYDKTLRLDGYVSLEINPKLAHDTAASIAEGKRLFDKLKKPNLMIKVPATPAGFPVIEELLADGINVNVTLIFSRQQYADTVAAFFKGLERLVAKTGDLSRIASVASVFVSRVDTVIDKVLDEKIAAAPAEKKKFDALKGKAAVANCRAIFDEASAFAASERFRKLAAKGAMWQRVLWGSTSTKNPAYPDIKYVTELIASPTVNTIPEKTLLAFLDHGEVKPGLTMTAAEARSIVETLKQSGIDVNAVCAKLLKEGVAAFETSFDELFAAIETKAKQLAQHPR